MQITEYHFNTQIFCVILFAVLNRLMILVSIDECHIILFSTNAKYNHCFALQDSYSYVRSTAPAVAYDSKQYYQQPTATAAVAAAQPQPSVAESYYQTGMLNTVNVQLIFTHLNVMTIQVNDLVYQLCDILV